jgi:hypothetical protein
MPGFEGAEREDHDEREAGVRLLDCGCSVGDVILNRGEAAGRTVREPKVQMWLVGNTRCIRRTRSWRPYCRFNRFVRSFEGYRPLQDDIAYRRRMTSYEWHRLTASNRPVK